ncbi:MAG: tetratricopeptide repeat protein, partial [Nitrospirae bacterium]
RFFIEEQKRQAEVELVSGTLRAIASKRKGPFSVNTPNSIAGVKGTDFVVTSKRRASFYFVNSGEVEVEGGSSSVLLKERTMTENYQGRKPILPVSLKENPDLEAALLKAMEMTSVDIPPVIKESALFEEILARWNINYAHYLADSGRYYEAETALKIAHALTARDYVRSEILMRIANIYSRYFHKPEESVKYYKELIEQYPDSVYYEMALYNLALSLYEMGKEDEARRYFERYLQEFPEGRYRYGVEYYLKNR